MSLRKTLVTCAAAVVALVTTAAHAAPIDVLWLDGSATYNAGIGTLASGGTNDASTWDPDSNGSNTWTIDFWSAGTPNFDDYDVLVIGSTCTPGCPSSSSDGFFNLGVDPALVLSHQTELAAARGDRTFVSGQDADWHFLNDSAGDSANARGFLVNAVNWAASGNGLGIVALADGISSSPNGWLEAANSFLAADINGARDAVATDNVTIPGATEAAFPINEGLSSAQLSNWGTSSHTRFLKSDLDPTIWTTINDYGPNTDYAVTIVSTETAGGGTTPIPAPGTLALFGLALLGVARLKRRA